MKSTPAPRAILATDLDGTLLQADGSVSPRTREVLGRARDSRVEVVFITGRPPMFLPAVVAEAGHTGAVICANGSVTLDAATMVPDRVHTFAPTVLAEVLSRMVASMPGSEYRTMMHRPGEDSIRVIGEGAAYPRLIRDRVAAGWQVFKLAVIGPDHHTPDSFLALAAGTLGTLAEVTHSSYGLPLVEIGPRGVSKGSALAAHAAAVGVPRADVHAVGDMPNDLPMLTVAGRSYAVANAHPDVIGAVGRVLPSNAEDGVAVLLEELLHQYG